MFIVKAEVRSDVGPQAYHLFEAQSVRIGKSDPIVPHGSYTERVVQLCDIDGMTFKALGVGHGLDDYSAVYVMNEKGKTVDSVYPGPRPTNRVYPVSMTGQSSQGVAVQSMTVASQG
jgi:hypothetical protein